VLGHTIRGVEGIYDRHSYDNEKAAALERLAELVERIINPPTDNVVPLYSWSSRRWYFRCAVKEAADAIKAVG
jgi:hypothetical protein